ncbi:beta-galactosidase A [[Emmonsia] crescens]|uniref:Beta-galactosidase n=1 Tax=[Emmonsia] crescens TaxID=73230 RepID=A0A0G2I2A2_9EURO|nr:beta-galactosidase A [Emmonsia crescens UAMH 3008]
MRFLSACAIACLALQSAAAVVDRKLGGFTVIEHPDPVKRDLLQDIVKWDNESLFINGERIMIFSAEFHPFRLPVPSLWLDVFQKIKALGFNCVSFYTNWALTEGKPGEYTAEGIFAWEPFFEAATEAGIYLLARPGPYINAEVSGGGFPGWLQRVKGQFRTSAKDYLAATDNYIAHIAASVAKAQITNGGPVILYQPENEYTLSLRIHDFPDGKYMQYVIDQAREAGIVVPMISNDAWAAGNNAPGTGKGEVDIYGHDKYPLGFDCANPDFWPPGFLPTHWRQLHLIQSPTTPYSLVEFQAGAYDPWGGVGLDKCSQLLNHEFERVFYKNNFSFGNVFLNLYMTFGGTNWGNLGHPGGYTSYDYGAPISEDRNITREKYSELKLMGNFMKVSPSYLNAVPGHWSISQFTTTPALTVTPLIGRLSRSSFFVLRHSEYTSKASTNYKLKLPTSVGSLTIPQLNGTLTLNGRDSKIHVTDYDVAGTNILYSTAEIFTWKKFGDRKVLVIYGGENERHELAVSTNSMPSVVEGSSENMQIKKVDDYVVLNWETIRERRIVDIDDLSVFILDRNSAYNYWVPEVPRSGETPGFSTFENTASSIIVKAGYLVRTAFVRGSELHIAADFNTTTPIEVIGAPKTASTLHINGEKVEHNVDDNAIWTTSIEYAPAKIDIPALENLEWKYIDSLPELQADYDDSSWTAADHKTTNNTLRPLTTPTSLHSSDYGYHAGYLIYRGHFVATGIETAISFETQGGFGYGNSAWLNGKHIGSWKGKGHLGSSTNIYSFPKLKAGEKCVFTVLVDNMGLGQNYVIGADSAKNPRGIQHYVLFGRLQSSVTWKLAGNLGGEDYQDRFRGPLNEGGLYIERQGWHQSSPPSQSWKSASPISDGIAGAGVGFFTAEFDLNIPRGWDVPLYFTFPGIKSSPSTYRVQLYVNGFQYGKYVSNLGPQTSFPVPQGILNYQGKNTIGITLWALDGKGAKIERFVLEYREAVRTGMRDVTLVDGPAWRKREGAC